VISLLHTGEALASSWYRDWLLNANFSEYPNLGIELITNGTLLPRYWDAMFPARRRMVQYIVSIDAASSDTYARVRGGDFSQVLKALELIEQDGVPLRINCTVSDANLSDLDRFVDLGERCGAEVILKPLLRFWHPLDQWEAMAVHRPEHPRHNELLSALQRLDGRARTNLFEVWSC
jgi:MoaA/NifB/PqqE/SkfB family radical SAM enzyme